MELKISDTLPFYFWWIFLKLYIIFNKLKYLCYSANMHND